MRIVWNSETAGHISGALAGMTQDVGGSLKRFNALFPEIRSVCRVPGIIAQYEAALKKLRAFEEMSERTDRGMKKMIELFESAERDNAGRIRANAGSRDSGEIFNNSGNAAGAAAGTAAAGGAHGQAGAARGNAQGPAHSPAPAPAPVRGWVNGRGDGRAVSPAVLGAIAAIRGMGAIAGVSVRPMPPARTTPSAPLEWILRP